MLVVFVVFLEGCKIMIWEDKTSDAYWESDLSEWGGSSWLPGFTDSPDDPPIITWVDFLTPVGLWKVGYFPNRLRVTFTGVDRVKLNIHRTLSEIFSAVSSEISSIEEIASISFSSRTYFEITKIEFGFEEIIPVSNGSHTVPGDRISTTFPPLGRNSYKRSGRW